LGYHTLKTVRWHVKTDGRMDGRTDRIAVSLSRVGPCVPLLCRLVAKLLSQYSTVVLTVVRVMIAKYRKSGIWGYRSSLTPEPVELK